MTLSPASQEVLYAGPDGRPLDARITEAYELNVHTGLVATADAQSALAAAAITHVTQPEHPSSLEGVDPWFAEIAERTRAGTAELFNRIGIDTPPLTAFQEAGVDFPRLQAGYATMTDLGLEPEVVLAPLLPASRWRELCTELSGTRPPLILEPKVSDHWHWGEIQGSGRQVAGRRFWQAAVIPGRAEPPLKKASYGTAFGHKGLPTEYLASQIPELEENKWAPTVAIYLAAQTRRLQTGVDLLDSGGQVVWLRGAFENAHDRRYYALIGGSRAGSIEIVSSALPLLAFPTADGRPTVWGSE